MTDYRNHQRGEGYESTFCNSDQAASLQGEVDGARWFCASFGVVGASWGISSLGPFAASAWLRTRLQAFGDDTEYRRFALQWRRAFERSSFCLAWSISLLIRSVCYLRPISVRNNNIQLLHVTPSTISRTIRFSRGEVPITHMTDNPPMPHFSQKAHAAVLPLFTDCIALDARLAVYRSCLLAAGNCA